MKYFVVKNKHNLFEMLSTEWTEDEVESVGLWEIISQWPTKIECRKELARLKNMNLTLRGKVDLRTCKEGDILISALGGLLKYIRPTTETEYLDHYVQHLDKYLGDGTRTDDGYVFKFNRKPETDHDIIAIIPKEYNKRFGYYEEDGITDLIEIIQERDGQLEIIRFNDIGNKINYSGFWVNKEMVNENKL